MHSSSKKWVSWHVRDKEDNRLLNTARRKICPNSPVWHENFNRIQHKDDWKAGMRRLTERKLAESVKLAEEKQRLRHFELPLQPAMRNAFGGKAFTRNRSNVLSRKTIFCPQWEDGKEDVAPWPEQLEMKYEGDDRISTDKLHRRFLGAPRVESNTTVTWQQKTVIPQYPFDDFYYPVPSAVDILLRTHYVPELEIDDEVGTTLLGMELMWMLDPNDQW